MDAQDNQEFAGLESSTATNEEKQMIRVLLAAAVILSAAMAFSSANAQSNVDYVTVMWTENGASQEMDIVAGGTGYISYDVSTSVNLRIHRSPDLPTPVKYWYVDMNNGNNQEHVTTASSWYFSNVTGPLDARIIAGVEVNGDNSPGKVTIYTSLIQPSSADLQVGNLTVNGSVTPGSYHVGQTVDLSCIVWNRGGTTAGATRLAYFIGTSSSPSGAHWEDDYVPSLGPDAGSLQGELYTFQSTDIGTRYFVFEADYLDEVDEGSNEGNNDAYFGPFAVENPPDAYIRGRLTYSQGVRSFGGCVAGVTVRALMGTDQYMDQTDDEGYYELGPLPPGTYTVGPLNTAEFSLNDWEFDTPTLQTVEVLGDVNDLDWVLTGVAVPQLTLEGSGFPPFYIPGQEFSVTLGVCNVGGASVTNADVFLTVSFPDDNVAIVSATSDGLQVVQPTTVYHVPDGSNTCYYQTPKTYDLVDASGYGIEAGDCRTLTLTLKPMETAAGALRINYHAAIGQQMAPGTSDYDVLDDQQGWWAKQAVLQYSGSPFLEYGWAQYESPEGLLGIDLITSPGIDMTDVIGLPLDESRDADRLQAIRIRTNSKEGLTQADALNIVATTQSVFKMVHELDWAYDVQNLVDADNLDFYSQRDPWWGSGPYDVFVPKETPNWWREVFIFGLVDFSGIDNESYRASVYADVIVDAVTQPDAYDSPLDNTAAMRRLMRYWDHLSTIDDMNTVMQKMREGGATLSRSQTSQYFASLKDAANASGSAGKFASLLGKVLVGIDVAAYAGDFYVGVVEHLSLHALMTTEAEERLVALESLIARLDNPDPALVEGVAEARIKFDQISDTYYSNIDAIIDEATEISTILDGAALAEGIYHTFSNSPLASALLPWALSWKVYSGIRVQTGNAMMCSLAGTLQRTIVSDPRGLAESMSNAVDGTSVESASALESLHLMNTSHYLSYYFYDRYLSISNNTLTHIYGWMRDILVLGGNPYSEFIDDLKEKRARALDYCHLSSPNAFLTRHNYAFSLSAIDDENAFLDARLNSPLPGSGEELVAACGISTLEGAVPFTIVLTDLSQNASSWNWHVGDLAIEGQGPHEVTISTPGTHLVYLEVSDGESTQESVPMNVSGWSPAPVADIELSPVSGTAPLEVSFYDNSTGGGDLQRLWLTGDGGQSNDEMFSHVYEYPGVYTVSFIVSNETGYDLMVLPNHITVAGPTASISLQTNIEDGAYVISGVTTRSGSGINPITFTDLPTGEYNVTFTEVEGYMRPQSQVVNLEGGDSPSLIGEYTQDETPPAAIADLAGVYVGADIILSWTAPGDDGDEGVAVEYDVRQGTEPITELNWDSPEVLQLCGEPWPNIAGSQEEFAVGDLSGELPHYFRLRARDEAGNWSDLSNQTLVTPSSEGCFHFTEETGESYVVVIDTISIAALELEAPSEVGVFDGDLCVGASTFTGEWPLAITAWADDPQTPAVDGYLADNEMIFMVAHIETCDSIRVCPAPAGFSEGDGTFGEGTGAQVALTTATCVSIFHVDASNTAGPWDGSEANPYQTIQDAVDGAQSKDTIRVAAGTYGEAVTVYSGVVIEPWNGKGRADVTIQPPVGSRCITVVDVVDTVYLSGLELTGGTPDGDTVSNFGGGMLIKGSPVIMSGCVIRDNTTITDAGGGGICCRDEGYLELHGCKLFGNIGGNYSGGAVLFSKAAGGLVDSCIMYDNYTSGGGGGIMVYEAVIPDPAELYQLTRNTIVDNRTTTTQTGAGVQTRRANCMLDNNIIAYNYVEDTTLNAESAGLMVDSAGTLIGIDCNVLYGNCSGHDYYTGTPVGPNDQVANPQFCDLELPDYHIAPTSPAAPANSGGCGLIGTLDVDPSCGVEPVLVVEPSGLVFPASEGGASPDPQAVSVTCSEADIEWSCSWSEAWLIVVPNAGTSPSTADVAVDITGLPVSTFVDTIWFMSPQAVNSPVPLTVQLAVGPAGEAVVSVSSHERTCENYLRVVVEFSNESGQAITGFTNGFEIYSTNAALWTSSWADTLGTLGGVQFDGLVNVGCRSCDGEGADTVTFGALSFFGSGMVDGFNDSVLAITLGAIDRDYDGYEICIDSAYYPETGEWLWSGGPNSFIPEWGGPYCVTLELNPCEGIRGDWNMDDDLNVGDLTYAVCYMFGDGPSACPILCFDESDYMPDGSLNITDIVSMLWVITGDPTGYPLYGCCEWPEPALAKPYAAGEVIAEYRNSVTRISVDSHEDLLGLQLRLEGDRTVAEIPLLLDAPWEVYWRYEGSQIKLGILDMTASQTLTDAKTAILELPGEWTVIDAEASNAQFQLVTLETGAQGSPSVPQAYRLEQNYPNPFNPSTTIGYYLENGGQVELAIYNLLGRKIRTLLSEYVSAGEHRVVWDGCDGNGEAVSSGVYLYRLTVGGHSEAKKMILMK